MPSSTKLSMIIMTITTLYRLKILTFPKRTRTSTLTCKQIPNWSIKLKDSLDSKGNKAYLESYLSKKKSILRVS